MGVAHWLAANWHDLSDGVNNTVQALGILAAGTFGYLRFVRGRVLHSTLALDLAAELREVNGRTGMIIDTEIRNAGSLRQLLDIDCTGMLEIRCAGPERWKEAQTRGDIDWPKAVTAATLNVLEDDAKIRHQYQLEPGEVFHETTLVSLPDGQWVAYKVTFAVNAKARHVLRTGKKQNWTTQIVVV